MAIAPTFAAPRCRDELQASALLLIDRTARGAASAAIALLAVAFLTGTDVFLGGRGLLPAAPTALFTGFGALVIAAALLAAVREPVTWRRNLQMLVERCRPALLALSVMTAAALGGAFLAGADWNDNGANIFLPVVGCCAVLIGIALGFLFGGKRWFLLIPVLSLLVTAGSMIADLFTPGAFSTVIQRAAGVAENANFAAYVVLLHCVLLLPWRRFSLAGAAVLVFSGLAVMITLSRSGLLVYLLISAAYVATALLAPLDPSKVRKYAIATACTAAVAIAAGVAIISTSEIFQTATGSQRIDALLGKGAFFTSDDERLVVLRQYSKDIERQPLTGYGTAYTKSQFLGPHNMYVSQWVNNGVLGLLSYCALLLAVAVCGSRYARLDAVALAISVAGMGLFSHDILDQRPFTLMLGIALALCCQGER
jgi:O-antigen ligase